MTTTPPSCKNSSSFSSFSSFSVKNAIPDFHSLSPFLFAQRTFSLYSAPGDRPFSWNSTVGEEEAACVSCVEEPRNPLRL